MLYYLCSKNKGADQLHSYCKADLRLCFRLCRLLVFPCGCSYVFSFYSVTPLCPYYVCYNPIMISFSVNGHYFVFYMTEHNYGDFCNQKQASTKNVNANLTGSLYGAT